MSSTPTAPLSTLPIVFLDPDSEAAQAALAQALQSIPQSAIVLGLIVKVVRNADRERIVNWEFAAPETLKSLALVLPSETTPSSKE
jgi:hypothetical protein